MDNLPIWAAVLIAIISAVGGKFLPGFTDLYKAWNVATAEREKRNAEEKLAKEKEAVGILQKRLDSLESEEDECRVRVQKLMEQIAELKHTLGKVEGELSAIKTYLNERITQGH